MRDGFVRAVALAHDEVGCEQIVHGRLYLLNPHSSADQLGVVGCGLRRKQPARITFGRRDAFEYRRCQAAKLLHFQQLDIGCG